MAERKAKIVATIGPSSNTIEMIEKFIRAGVDVARVNMSHGTHEGHQQVIQNIREASKRCGREIAILADLQGPKIRVSKLPAPLQLKSGDEWAVAFEDDIAAIKQEKVIPTTYRNIVTDAKVGARILFDDGLLVAVVSEIKEKYLMLKVSVGGELKSNKGINLPDVKVSAPSLTEKDEKDLYFGLKNEVDYIALSFVRTAEDIKKVKFILHKLKVDIPIIAKIEKPEAVDNIDEIIAVTDAIMIARGDMGVEVGNHLVPGIQKKIIAKCNLMGVPVITATQMLESMIKNSGPTRAEASDVANAVWDGTDAVMLSGESASGDYPLESVQMMDSIIREAEKNPKERPLLRGISIRSVTSANQVAASLIAEKIGAKLILSITEKGNSCLKMTRYRSKAKVLGVTSYLATVRKMSLYWGITPYFFPYPAHEQHGVDLDKQVINKLRADGELNISDKVVITHGDGQYFMEGTSNSIRVEIVKDLGKEEKKNSDYQEVEFSRGRIILDTQRCSSCQQCMIVCPYDIWISDPSKNNETRIDVKNAALCVLDAKCVESCPTGAIEIIPKSF